MVAAELVLECGPAAGKQGRVAFGLLHVDLVILDELGYLPFSQAGGALLVQLYERTSVIVTTNLSFAEWPSVFGDAKDRIQSREKIKRGGEKQPIETRDIE